MLAADGDPVLPASDGILLAVLSGALVFAAIAAVRLARTRVTLNGAVPALGFVFWWAFVWLSPQVFHFCMALADGLAVRAVIGWPPGPERLVELLSFRARDSAADIALGALGWVMIAAGFPRA